MNDLYYLTLKKTESIAFGTAINASFLPKHFSRNGSALARIIHLTVMQTLPSVAFIRFATQPCILFAGSFCPRNEISLIVCGWDAGEVCIRRRNISSLFYYPRPLREISSFRTVPDVFPTVSMNAGGKEFSSINITNSDDICYVNPSQPQNFICSDITVYSDIKIILFFMAAFFI